MKAKKKMKKTMTTMMTKQLLARTRGPAVKRYSGQGHCDRPPSRIAKRE
jgi:hypothetical protein